MCLDEGESMEKCWCVFMEVSRPSLLGSFAVWPWHLSSRIQCKQVVVLGAPKHGRPTSLSPHFQSVQSPGAMQWEMGHNACDGVLHIGSTDPSFFPLLLCDKVESEWRSFHVRCMRNMLWMVVHGISLSWMKC